MLKVKTAILLIPLRIKGQARTTLSGDDFVLTLEGDLLHIRFADKRDRSNEVVERHWVLSSSQYARLEVEDE
jgi:hypothetical protein